MKTRHDYIRHVRAFSAFIGRTPDTATGEDVRRFQLHQSKAGIGVPTRNGAVSALRFFFTVTLDRPDLARRLTVVRWPRRLPEVLSPEEVALLLEAAPGPKYKAAMAAAYGAGLRVSEVVALKVSDIDSERMLIRIDHGKGGKDRHAMLSPTASGVLARLVAGRAAPRRNATPGLAVPRPQPGQPALHSAVEPRRPRRGAGGRDLEAGVAAHASPQLRHPPA